MKEDTDRSKLPRIVDLAAEPDFDLGPLRVQPALRRIRTTSAAGDAEESVEPRVMQALVALAQADGAVLSRDALTDRCWGGRIVGEDAINRCIGKVRKLADVTTPPAFTIETVAKVGYRLKRPHDGGNPAPPPDIAGPAVPAPAPAATLGADPAPLASQARPVRSAAVRRPTWLQGAAALLAVTVTATAMVWHLRPQPRWVVQGSRSLPAPMEGETSPCLSPTGTIVAYTLNSQNGPGRIYVRTLAGGAPVALSDAGDNADFPAWAADGVHLAYVAADPGADGSGRIMVTTVPGGTPVVVARLREISQTGIAWLPGTSSLFVTDLGGTMRDAIFRVDTETGKADQLTFPDRAASDISPRVSADGKYLAYSHFDGLQGQTLRLRDLVTGQDRSLVTDPDISAFDWMADSRTLIASVRQQSGTEIRAYPIDGGNSYQIYATPARVYALSADAGGQVAIGVNDHRDMLARASATPRTTPDIVDPAAGNTGWPAFAPDGTLAFISDRSGQNALWLRAPGAEPKALLNFGLRHIERPVWSPDGTRIAFVEIWKGDISIHIVTRQGERIAAFSVPSVGFGEPTWTPDGRTVIAFDKHAWQAIGIEVANPQHREPVAGRLWDGVTSWQGHTYAHHGDLPGLWRLDGGKPSLVTPDYSAYWSPPMAFTGNEILLPDNESIVTPDPGHIPRIMAQPLNGWPAWVAYYAPAALQGTPFAIDKLTDSVLYVSRVSTDSHIDLLTLGRQ